jgi:hypothetical protein
MTTQLIFKPLDASTSSGSEVTGNGYCVVPSVNVETDLVGFLAVAASRYASITFDPLRAASPARDADLGRHRRASGGLSVVGLKRISTTLSCAIYSSSLAAR